MTFLSFVSILLEKWISSFFVRNHKTISFASLHFSGKCYIGWYECQKAISGWRSFFRIIRRFRCWEFQRISQKLNPSCNFWRLRTFTLRIFHDGWSLLTTVGVADIAYFHLWGLFRPKSIVLIGTSFDPLRASL